MLGLFPTPCLGTLSTALHFICFSPPDLVQGELYSQTVVDTKRQLSDLCDGVGVAVISGGADCSQSVRRALLGGLFVNVAEHVGEGKYKTVSTWVGMSST